MVTTALILTLLAQTPEAPVRRLALIAGANDGGRSRVLLRYAGSDASAVKQVLMQLGGVESTDIMLLLEPTPQGLMEALDSLAQRAESARKANRVEVFFYYSGHRDESGLLLKGDRLGYSDLRRRLNSLPADVRVAVLDSCASGALNLTKGGAPRPAFLVDSATALTGHAYLTSASADEAAQESERLKASVFTYALLSGLRGAADSNRDGRVTLAEGYQHAFAETLARTTSTQAGPQRPGWEIQLVGTGDLVLTDVRAAAAKLVLDERLGGRVNVLSAAGGLTVEVAKTAGKAVELGLEAGEYRVVVDDGSSVRETKVSLSAQSSQLVTPEGLVASKLEPTVRRGDAPRTWLPVEVAFVPPLSIAGLRDPAPRVNFGLGIIGVRTGALDGLLIGSVFAWVDDMVRGVALGGVLTKTGSLYGIGISGGPLVATGDVLGLTVSLATLSTGHLDGLHTNLVSVAGGAARGVHASLVSVVPRDVQGVQVGLGNIAAQRLTGLQAGLLNVAWVSGLGAQLGLLNIGGEVTGAQVGLLNIASSVTGTQVGLVNIAKTSTAPIGLVNVITQGRLTLALWASETALASLALKAGSRHVYGILQGSFNPRGPNAQSTFSAGLGLGVRASFGRWYRE